MSKLKYGWREELHVELMRFNISLNPRGEVYCFPDAIVVNYAV